MSNWSRQKWHFISHNRLPRLIWKTDERRDRRRRICPFAKYSVHKKLPLFILRIWHSSLLFVKLWYMVLILRGTRPVWQCISVKIAALHETDSIGLYNPQYLDRCRFVVDQNQSREDQKIKGIWNLSSMTHSSIRAIEICISFRLKHILIIYKTQLWRKCLRKVVYAYRWPSMPFSQIVIQVWTDARVVLLCHISFLQSCTFISIQFKKAVKISRIPVVQQQLDRCRWTWDGSNYCFHPCSVHST